VEIMLLPGHIYDFDDRLSFRMLVFEKGLQYHNFDFRRLLGNHFWTLYESFV